MQTSARFARALATVVLIAGCTASSHPGSSIPKKSPTSTVVSSREPTPATALTPTPTITPARVKSRPSPPACLTDATPRPDSVDGVTPSTHPGPPGNVTRDSVVNWTRAFETAYFRNGMVADESSDDDVDLTEVSAYAEVRDVNHTARGYVLRFVDSGATNYASGLHGDRWMDVGYVINDTHVVRVPLDDHDGPVRASEGTVVVGCR